MTLRRIGRIGMVGGRRSCPAVGGEEMNARRFLPGLVLGLLVLLVIAEAFYISWVTG